MTDQRLQPNGQDGRYKQVYCKHYLDKPYSSARIGYDDYLHTNVWREIRNERLKIDNFRCVKCGTGINVEVHHLRYPEVWGMENVYDDLVTLCAPCHAETHKTDIQNGVIS